MAVTSEQIEEIKRLADTLKKWRNGDVPQACKDYSKYVQLIVLVEPQTNIVLMGLSVGMPGTARAVHVKLQELLSKAVQADSLRKEHTEEARLEDSNLLKLAQDLILMLERIAKNAGQDRPTLNAIEQKIVGALRNKTLVGEKLAKKAGSRYNHNFKKALSGLRKRGILGNKSPGYFLEPEYEFLLKKSD